MHTIKQKLASTIKIEPVPKLATDDSIRQLPAPVFLGPPPTETDGFMSLRLLGRAQTTLESQAIAGVPKVKLNIGKISEAKQKILNAAFQSAP